jgi:hypothetical protein
MKGVICLNFMHNFCKLSWSLSWCLYEVHTIVAVLLCQMNRKYGKLQNWFKEGNLYKKQLNNTKQFSRVLQELSKT